MARRTVRHPNFTKTYGEIQGVFPRAKEFIEGIISLISRDPGLGDRIDGDGEPVWMVASRLGKGMIPVAVFYQFDRREINLLSIIRTVKDGD